MISFIIGNDFFIYMYIYIKKSCGACVNIHKINTISTGDQNDQLCEVSRHLIHYFSYVIYGQKDFIP